MMKNPGIPKDHGYSVHWMRRQNGGLFFLFAWNSTHSRQFPCLGHLSLGHAQSCLMSAMIA